MVEWSLQETGQLILFLVMLPLFLMIGGCVLKLITNPPDAMTKQNFLDLGKEIELMSNEKMPKYESVPFQIKTGFIISAFNKADMNPSQCNKKACICLYNSPDSKEPKLCKTISAKKELQFDIPMQGFKIFPMVPYDGSITSIDITMEEKEGKIAAKIEHIDRTAKKP